MWLKCDTLSYIFYTENLDGDNMHMNKKVKQVVSLMIVVVMVLATLSMSIFAFM